MVFSLQSDKLLDTSCSLRGNTPGLVIPNFPAFEIFRRLSMPGPRIKYSDLTARKLSREPTPSDFNAQPNVWTTILMIKQCPLACFASTNSATPLTKCVILGKKKFHPTNSCYLKLLLGKITIQEHTKVFGKL